MEWWGRQKGLRQTLRIEVAAGGKGRTIDRVTGELDAATISLDGNKQQISTTRYLLHAREPSEYSRARQRRHAERIAQELSTSEVRSMANADTELVFAARVSALPACSKIALHVSRGWIGDEMDAVLC